MKPYAVILCALVPCLIFAHPGGLDQNGGHTDKRTGQYHTHRAPQSQPQSSPSTASGSRSTDTTGQQKSTPTGVLPRPTHPLNESEIDTRVQEYFRITNHGVINTLPRVPSERNVTDETKRAVIARDGGVCVVCGSREKLEVDHCIALMNGGTNMVTNLATLCDSCHLKKTRMDTSLRRKREEKFGKPLPYAPAH